MFLIAFIFTKFNKFLFLQPGELPIPKDAKPYQKYGNYSLMDFLTENWFFLLAILLLIFMVWVYLRDRKKEEKKKREEEQDKARLN